MEIPKKASPRYSIVESASYRRDYKRIKRSGNYDIAKLEALIDLLAEGKELPMKYHHHYLRGDLAEYEECHIEFDWLLLFKRHHDILVLQLIRTGTHDQLF